MSSSTEGPDKTSPGSTRRLGSGLWPRLIVSVGLAAAFAWTLHRGGLPILPSRELLVRIGWGPAVAYALWFSLLWVLRAHRWVHLLRPIADLPRRDALAAGLVGSAAIVVAPLRLGELARPYLISGRSVTFAQAMGVVGAERVVDGLFVGTMLTMGLLGHAPLAELPDHLGGLPLPVAAVPRAAWLSLALFGGATAAMMAFYFARERAEALVHTLVGAVSPRGAAFVAGSVGKVADGLSFLRQPGAALPFLRDTFVYWGMNVVGLWLLLRASGFDAELSQAAALIGVMTLGLMVPAGPGFFGAFQLSTYCGLALYFPVPHVVAEGAAFVFVVYVAQISVAISFGVLGLVLLPPRPTN